MQLTHIVPCVALAATNDGQPAAGGMTPLDWVVIALYALGMLAVGWYYARRTSTTDDYLLGGRNMSPWKVGLSLFATLLSTLTYLALPGEMIKYGPMVLSQLVSMPFIALVVGWLLIPFIMRLRVTSAYEILEIRFGLSVRLVGSSIFLTLRLFWMSLVIYATANTVLVPILGLDPSAVPWVCVALGLVTVVYTSVGGLRAVVLTDVLQTLIMFGGAILALIVITVQLGGVGQWWPRQWPAHWQPPVFWYDSQVRFTFVGGFLSMFTWYICTAGSDQMAIQRYLATRDARAARRMFNISLLANVLLWPFLAAVGLALLAYFNARPGNVPCGSDGARERRSTAANFHRSRPAAGGHRIGDRRTAGSGDVQSVLGPEFCVLSDHDGFHRPAAEERGTEPSHVQIAKYVSLAVGVVVVALGALVGQVEGNLLELCYKIANLLSVPLFLLFFMAMFVPWATSFGTLVGAACSAAVAVAVGYFQVFGLTFIWMMPAAFVVGASAGMLASLVPIGRKDSGGIC